MSLFLDVNPQTIAKMDHFSLLQIIERTPELRFNYIGLNPNKILRLKKYSFAIINSAPSNDKGDFWIMIARLDKIYYFAYSLGRKRFNYSVLKKKLPAHASKEK